MKTLKYLFFVIILVFSNNACNQTETAYKNVIFKGNVFGTYYSVSYFSEDGTNYKEEIDSVFKEFNSSVSYYDKESLISKINRNETNKADKYFETVFRKAYEISEKTDGYFDVTVTALVNLWGFGFENQGEVTKRKIDSILDFVGYKNAHLESGVVIKDDDRISFDFNAIAKGYAADVIGAFLEDKNVNIYMIEIGGDLITKGVKPDGSKWKIGIERPVENYDDPQDWQYIVELEDQAIATSGNYRRYYEKDGLKYSHTINPKTGYPVNHNLLSVSVIADDAITADAYATAFMTMGLEKSIEFVENREDIEAFFIYSLEHNSFETYASKGLSVIDKSDI